MDWVYSRSSQISSLIFGGGPSSISAFASVLKNVGLNVKTSPWEEFELMFADGVLEDEDDVDVDVEVEEDWSRLYSKLVSV